MKTLIIILFTLLPFNRGCLYADIVILADISGSVQGYEDYIREATETFISRFELSEEGVKIGIVLFNVKSTVLSDITGNKDLLLRNASHIKIGMAGRTTDLSNGIMVSAEELSSHGRIGSKKVIILISDGKPDDPQQSLKLMDDIKMLINCTVFGVLIKNAECDPDYMKIISSPNCYVETYYQMLAEEMNKLDICT